MVNAIIVIWFLLLLLPLSIIGQQIPSNEEVNITSRPCYLVVSLTPLKWNYGAPHNDLSLGGNISFFFPKYVSINIGGYWLFKDFISYNPDVYDPTYPKIVPEKRVIPIDGINATISVYFLERYHIAEVTHLGRALRTKYHLGYSVTEYETYAEDQEIRRLLGVRIGYNQGQDLNTLLKRFTVHNFYAGLVFSQIPSRKVFFPKIHDIYIDLLYTNFILDQTNKDLNEYKKRPFGIRVGFKAWVFTIEWGFMPGVDADNNGYLAFWTKENFFGNISINIPLCFRLGRK